MFNVLPDILKEGIIKDYRLRRLVVLCLFILSIQVTFMIFMFPSWIISKYQEKEVSTQINYQNNSLASKNTNNILQVINDTNQKLNVINTTFRYPKVVPIFNSIISLKTADISLRQIKYTFDATSGTTLSISGVSASREALVSFVKSLQDSSLFSNVDSPVSNLEKDKNIEFVISLNTAKSI